MREWQEEIRDQYGYEISNSLKRSKARTRSLIEGINWRYNEKKISITLITICIMVLSIPCSAHGAKVTALDADSYYSMALTDDGNVWMWGDNHQTGELGNSSFTNNKSLFPVHSNISNVKMISAGFDTVSALKNDGTIWSWGETDRGVMGNGYNAEYGYKYYTSTPIKANITNVTDISAGTCFTDAIKNDSTVWQWGEGWRMGLEKNTSLIIWSPIQVKGLSNIKEVKAGMEHSVALDNEGRVWTWGANISKGEILINGSAFEASDFDLISTPIQVPISDVKAITAGSDFSLALKNDGTIWGWGDDTFGQLGDGVYWGGFTSQWSHTARPAPVMVQGLADVVAIDSYGKVSLALKNDGTVWEWGRENSNILTTPTQVPIDNVVAIACGDNHLMALKSDGSVWSWGNNQFGQLGTGTTDSSSTPVKVLLNDIQTSGSTTTNRTVNTIGDIINKINSYSYIIALIALLIIACGIVYYIKKIR